MNCTFSISLVLLIALIFTGCERRSDTEAQRLSWVTEDPLTIPYRIRYQRYERPNLLRNGSFETGRTFSIDSGRTSFVLDGWQQYGEHIEWVDISLDSIYASDEVFTGSRAVKIIRKKANETDQQGDGIVSEFIRVIPGNYDFTFYTRLTDILPSRPRLGTRMFDGIEVKLLYFDRNKILLDSRQYFPQLEQTIDHSNKSLSFANFLSIPSFGWGKIIGKSHSFPFPEGNIPSNAHFLKVSLGLKGTGTMWIDSVALRYSIKNFSVAERMSFYADTSFSIHHVVIPTPKKIRSMESVIYYSPDSDVKELPVILVPHNAGNLTLKAALHLREALFKGILTASDGQANREDILITSSLPASWLNGSRLVFSLGNTAVSQRNREVMPFRDIEVHHQGYYIHTLDDISNLVFLNGNNETGIYYAVLTAIQLFDSRKPVFHNARVIDYPDFTGRFYIITDWNAEGRTDHGLQMADELVAYKFNGAVLDINPENASSSELRNLNPFRDPGSPGEPVTVYGMIASNRICPGTTVSGLVPVKEVGREMVQWMRSMADATLSAGLDGIIVAPSFRLPDDSSLCYTYPLTPEVDRNPAVNGMVDIRSLVTGSYPGRSLLYCPPLFHNELMDLSNVFVPEDMAILKDIPVLWSGSSFFGDNTDDADLERFVSQTGGRPPVFLDNSMLMATRWGLYGGAYPHYPGRLRVFNIFEPFGNTGIREIFSGLDRSHIFINHTALSEIDMIRLATAADFTWNMEQYDPDFSLWKVLVMRYGVDVASELIAFASNYAEMLEILLRLKINEQVARNLKNGKDKLQVMDVQMSTLEDILGNEHRLTMELRSLHQILKEELIYYQRSPSTG
ncbi:MAG: hypothetical protein JXA61_08060 [Bacteroidales bacterium]|nr:hypothetical protein [Bacteroidales bacterium]